MNKRTEELVNELKECQKIEDYMVQNEGEFQECTLAEYIAGLMQEKELRKIDVVKRSRLSEVYTYQILAGMKNPDRDKLLCIVFALELNFAEANRLLKNGGKAELYAKNKRDSIIIFALEKKLTLDEANDLLYELQQEILS